uniref:Carboxypeptidase n=1 Tax=Dolopus genitalis TaxID=2488630 RepID=A0A3G5BIH1_DOLGE|nr:venom polypeptide [Dolopus genitalis]
MSPFNLVSLCVLLSTSFLVEGKKGFGPGEQDWGHITVRDGAHLFYWLYYTTAQVSNYTERPLAIWLQGGPGGSSTGYGNFEELGPLTLELTYRNHTWVKDMNVIFLDNPVGTGFSYVDNKKYLTTDNKMIALDFVEFLKQFYRKHPEFRKTPLHIFSESYGGKMAAEIALELYKAIKAKKIDCNFQSVALGDAWVSPMDSVYSWAPLLLQMGIIDHPGHDEIMAAAKRVEVALKNGKFVEATNLWGITQRVLLSNSAGVDFYNILKKTPAYFLKMNSLVKNLDVAMYDTLVHFDRPISRRQTLDQLMKGAVSKTLNIPRHVTWGSQSNVVFSTLSGDFMKPVVHIVEELLNKTDINVNVFSGHLDLICATPGTINWVDRLRWHSWQQYYNAPRRTISVNGVLEGYFKQGGRFAMYWVNRAGHMVPNDNPAAMSFILKKTTNFG